MTFARTMLAIVLAVSLAALPARVDAMPMPDGCDQHQGTKAPGACSTYCSSIPALPTLVVASADAAPAEGIALPVEAPIEGIGPSPEPHPPKLA